MHTAPQHLSPLELEQVLPAVLDSPRDSGRLTAIIVRPAANERRPLKTAQLTPEGGIDGDRWCTDSFYQGKGGTSDPRCQVSLMNVRYLRHIAGEEEAICLAGDNLIVDFDLSEANLPAGSRLRIGDSVIVEISDLAHTGCSKFAARYGNAARSFSNNARGKSLHLRGRYAQIINGGIIEGGDAIVKVVTPSSE